MIFLLLFGIFELIAAFQFSRGKWLGILAGSTFGQRNVTLPKKNKWWVVLFNGIMGIFFILIYILDYFGIHARLFFGTFTAIVIIYAAVAIVRAIRHWIKYGDY
ncbi:hypothetical protein FC83_GL003369 [Agrilactobacillus composti DSM 18527 = JCM 14202]|uniref:Integral membrane protein n=1 Tax=Agrilactobacillus composti DSM 18527 = JCM 14202 TaxID=1423734 RepID=X0QP00_9LACO|nr:hypothetical protein [Agrilactobacillus composti]KRM33282.1 hypothetical protein FC83_GL003369 [Agrilactobacillus composti DSM 18527 = JCM 14202]GAF40360.1 hypothetical protein JCM14202_2256 [Agrilactobacillus composti DSM 18527 = JCM 14202]